MRQKYLNHINYLLENPDQISDHWSEAAGLFQMARRNYICNAGCLTMIRTGEWNAQTPEWTDRIRRDTRIPYSTHELEELKGEKLEQTLIVFASYQNQLDDEFGEDRADLEVLNNLGVHNVREGNCEGNSISELQYSGVV